MAGERNEDSSEAAVRRARALMTEAMDLLEAYGASQPAAAHLALALDELGQRIEEPKSD